MTPVLILSRCNCHILTFPNLTTAPSMEELKRSLTREELHELVWSTPIVKLAERFGLSDRGFAKICARYLVPTPPRGYWARVEAGLPAKRTPLRSVENPALHNVRIGNSTIRLSAGVRYALVNAKAEKAAAKLKKQSEPAVGTVQVPVELVQPGALPHPFLVIILKQLRKSKPDANGAITSTGFILHERSLGRVEMILHNLALICEEHNCSLKFSESAYITFGDESVRFALTEEKRRAKHVPSPEEKAEYERILAKRARDKKDLLWSFERIEPWPEFDTLYTGKLTIGYSGYATGLRKSWSDGKSQRVETSLSDFVSGMKLVMAANAEDRRIREETERRRQALRRRRELATQREEREGKRLSHLGWIAKTRAEIDELRTTINAVPKAENLPDEYGRMLKWAEQRLSTLEAKTTVEAIQANLIEQNLFPDPDNLLDPEGDPPPRRNYWDD